MINKLDYQKIKHFWNQRGRRNNPVENIGNLEDEPELHRIKVELEREKMLEYATLKPDHNILDLGAGSGFWSIELARKVKKVVAVDFSESMLELGINNVKKNNITNINFVQSACQDYKSDIPFDLIFISGLFLYLNDSELEKTMLNILSYSHKDTMVIFRDGTGIGERYEFTNRYSENLKASYSATYRTREEIIKIFESKDFCLVKDDDVFNNNSLLNKYTETRLRIYLFKKT